MTRLESIKTRLLQLPEEIAEQESCLISALTALESNRAARDAAGAHLLTREDSPIDGKNAELRGAQILLALARETRTVHSCEEQVLIQRCALKRLENEFRALRAVAALIAGEERE